MLWNTASTCWPIESLGDHSKSPSTCPRRCWVWRVPSASPPPRPFIGPQLDLPTNIPLEAHREAFALRVPPPSGRTQGTHGRTSVTLMEPSSERHANYPLGNSL